VRPSAYRGRTRRSDAQFRIVLCVQGSLHFVLSKGSVTRNLVARRSRRTIPRQGLELGALGIENSRTAAWRSAGNSCTNPSSPRSYGHSVCFRSACRAPRRLVEPHDRNRDVEPALARGSVVCVCGSVFLMLPRRQHIGVVELGKLLTIVVETQSSRIGDFTDGRSNG